MSVAMYMWPLPEGEKVEDEAAKAAKEAAAAAPVKPRIVDADDPRWVPPPTVALDGVFGFPETPEMEGDTYALHLALFGLQFDDNINTAQVTVSCDLGSTDDGEGPGAEWKVAFFRWPAGGIGGEFLDGPGFDTTGAQQIVLSLEESERYSVAILLRRRRTEQDVPFPASFHISYTHHGDYQHEQQAAHNILTSKSESIPWTPLSWAAANGWEDCVKMLLNKKGVAQLDHNGRSALSWSAGGGQVMVTQLLLEEPGIQPDEADIGGRTPLSWAAENGHIDIINLLLAQPQPKIDFNRPDRQGRIPLSWAAGNGHDDAVIILINAIKNGEKAMAPIGEGNFNSSPVFWAAKNEQESTLRILMEEESLSSDIYSQSSTLPLTQFYLHKAAQQGWFIFTKLLIDKKVHIDSSDPGYDDRTPLCVAAEQGHAEVVETLLKAGAARNHQTTKARDTPLGLAIRSGHEATVKVLLNAGASVHLRNAKGEAPMDLANHHPTLFHMVAAVDKVGRLAETADELDSSVDHEFKATVIDFVSVSGSLTPCAVEIAVDELLESPWVSTADASSALFRWLHLPANNMRWIELLMARLYNNSASAYRVLKSERWVNRQHHGSTGVHYARFMRSQCQAFPSAALWALDGEGTDYHTDLVLFMPFLHWDFEEMHSSRETIANCLSQPHNMGKLARDQKLVKVYLTNEHPLHIRRTLDQYYYHTATDTKFRDGSQVLGYYQAKNCLQPRILTMVDQLWLWVLKGEQGKPDTVVSCFPVLDPAHPDQLGLTNVLCCVKLRLLDEPASVQTAYDLAGLIAATCSRLYLDRASTLSFENTKSTLQFSELYETEVSDIIQEESVLFGEFTKLEKENVASIQREIVLLSRIKSTLDELNIMAMLFNDQRNMLKVMDGIVKFISSTETADQSLEADSDSDSSSIETKEDPDEIAKTEEAYAGQRATVIWGARNDPDDFSLPLAMVNASIDEINAMLERAERASQSIDFLIDLKLKQNSVMDAQESLKMTRETTKQGRTVLIFTLTTIVFLPLSFMTSFFTLDISQFRTNAEGKLDLGYVSYIVFPISSFISAVLIWTAFRIEYIEAAWIWTISMVRRILDQVKASTAKKIDGPRNLHTNLPMPKVGRGSDLEAQSGRVPTVGSVLPTK